MNNLNIFYNRIISRLNNLPCKIIGLHSKHAAENAATLASVKLNNYESGLIFGSLDYDDLYQAKLQLLIDSLLSLSPDVTNVPVAFLHVNLEEFKKYSPVRGYISLRVLRNNKFHTTNIMFDSNPHGIESSHDLSAYINLLSFFLFDVILIGTYDSWEDALNKLLKINKLEGINIKCIEDQNISVEEQVILLRSYNPMMLSEGKFIYPSIDRPFFIGNLDDAPEQTIPVINTDGALPSTNRDVLLLNVSNEKNIQVRELFLFSSRDIRIKERKNMNIVMTVQSFNDVFDLEKSFPANSYYSSQLAKIDNSEEAKEKLFSQYCLIFWDKNLQISLIGNEDDVVKNKFNDGVNFSMWEVK